MDLNKLLKSKLFIGLAIAKKVVLVLFLLYSSSGKGNELSVLIDSANAQYNAGNYAKAAQLYEQVVQSGQDAPELYFNLGNAYFKSKKVALAILNYERAKKLNPNDEDIIVNLKLANQQTEDKIDNAPQLFFKEWTDGIVDMTSEKNWSLICIFTLIIALALFGLYVVSNNRGFKQIGFFGGCLILILSITTFFIAKSNYKKNSNSSEAIITAASVTITGSPNEKGTKLFILHEGTKVKIINTDAEWTEIKLANGNVGWLKTDRLTSI